MKPTKEDVDAMFVELKSVLAGLCDAISTMIVHGEAISPSRLADVVGVIAAEAMKVGWRARDAKSTECST